MRTDLLTVLHAFARLFARLFSNADVRRRWRDQSGMLVALSGTREPVVSIECLIAIKRPAGRPKDLEDAARLVDRQKKQSIMNSEMPTGATPAFGGWQDGEQLRKCSFLQRTPQQRLEWRVQALEVACTSGALRPFDPDSATWL